MRSPDGLCDIGYFCNIGSLIPNPTDSSNGGNICAAGGYCDLGSYQSSPCAPGTFNTNTGGKSEADCKACTAGFYCTGTTGLGYPAETGPCVSGFYCTGGATTPKQNIAAKGTYTVLNTGAIPKVYPTAEIKCAKKTYNPYPAQAACINCELGYYCNEVGLAENIVACPEGQYCPISTDVPVDCPIGTFNHLKNGGSEATNCYDCLAGNYCSTAGKNAVTGLCDAGYYCKTKAEKLTETTDRPGFAGPCPIGHYCPQGSVEPVPCPPGTF